MSEFYEKLKKYGRPTFICKCEPKEHLYDPHAFYQRDWLAHSPYKGECASYIMYCAGNDPSSCFFTSPFTEKEATIIESFIDSDDPQKKQALKDFVQEDFLISASAITTYKDHVEAFNKLENIYEHNLLNDSKLATLRKKIAHGVDETLGTNLEEKKLAKPLKKFEKVVSDKLFGKVNE